MHSTTTPLLTTALLLAVGLAGCEHDPDAPLPAEDDASEGGGSSEGSREEPGALQTDQTPQLAPVPADCCETSSDPSCSDAGVSACVCDADPYCCNNAWDSLCVSEVQSLGCGTCVPDLPCCETDPGPGCEAPAVESCVCAADPYCCNTAWDALCVGEVDSLGCGTCTWVDIEVTDLSLPSSACPGQDLAPDSQLVLTNIGTGDITSLFHVGWYLSSDPTLDSADRLLLGGRDQVSALAAGAAVDVSLGVNVIPSDAPLGPQYIIVSADEFDGVAEPNEFNNLATSPVTLGPCPVAGEWALGIGGTGSEALGTGSAVAVDNSGNVYVVGTFYSPTVDIDGATLARQGSSDAYLASYDADGNHRWSIHISSDDWDFGRGVEVDGAGNVYVIGESEGALDLGGGPLPHSGSSRDLFVASYTAAGVHRWSQRYGGTGFISSRDIAVNDAGDVAVVGSFTGNIDLGGGLLINAGATDMFALALDTSGAHQWSRNLGDTGSDAASSVAIDPTGELTLVGNFAGTVDFGLGAITSAGSADSVVLRLDATGIAQWEDHYGGSGIDIPSDVTLDSDGNAFLIGTFSGTATIGGSPLTASGSNETVIASYAPDGVLRWARQGGGSGLDYGRGIAVDGGGDVVITGSSFGAADFGGPPVGGAGFYDAWFAGLAGPDGLHQWSSAVGTSDQEEGFALDVAPSGAIVAVGDFSGTITVVGTTLSSAGADDTYVMSFFP